MVVLVVRTRRPFYKSRPGTALLWLTGAVLVAAMLLPYTPLGTFFQFEYLPVWLLPVILGIVVLYVGAAEITKRIFYSKIGL
jgi:Mg2+-importing ATPase